MEWLFFIMITAFLLGFLGSLHCIGMCGPIVLALPKYKNETAIYVFSRVVYNAGRVLTYILLGLIAGGIGQIISLAGFQSGLSIVLGILILLLLFTPVKKYLVSVSMGKIWKKTIGPLFKKQSLSSLFFIGFLNGFLPCGLVYAAMAAAAASGSSFYGAGFMLIFGAGTIPALIAVSLFGKFTHVNFQAILRKILPAAAFVLGCLLILRGLSLGIPYISPDFAPVQVGESLFIPYCH